MTRNPVFRLLASFALVFTLEAASAEVISLSCEAGSRASNVRTTSILIDLGDKTINYAGEIYTILRVTDALITAEAPHPAGSGLVWALELDRITGGMKAGTRSGSDRVMVVSGTCKRAAAKF